VESYTAELVSAGYAEHATILKSAAVEDFIPASIESASALTASKAIPVPMMEIYSGGIEHGEVEMVSLFSLLWVPCLQQTSN
jgi:hypothetical protein